ncbi:uncharacterized protein LTR77_005350 [Saxophila tyrrhenica]|uniref:GABA permease n=1 Tax=Saxophila tyrrhenica TaxID=1690608 RepID=A0AAV9PCH1_9PEZI|nr:hypothetical protein LTR77_005350 [Saxophila tyrrhenica]
MAASSSSFTTSVVPQSKNDFEMAERKLPQISIGELRREEEQDDGTALDNDEPFDPTLSTASDRYQMNRMGKQQAFVRHFKPMATFSFNAMATCVWEFGIFSVSQGLVDGGRAGLFWSTVVHAVGFVPVVLSMAEMASIAPTAGGQYHWVSELAHPKWQKPLSYITGWISTMAWQAGNAVGVFLTGTLIQVIILENNPNYMFPAWHGSLLVMTNIVFTVAGNILLSRYIPRVQTLFFVLHILAFLCVIVPILVNAPKASAAEVFTEFDNTGGWPNTGVAVLAGQLSAIYMMCGTDSAHISEEVKSAGRTVPKSMISVYGVNMVITLTCWLVICFAMPNVNAALADPSLYPVIYIMKQSMSIKWVTVELTMIVALVLFANVCYLTAVSRDLFAFARDGGTPCPNWVARVHPKYGVPINAGGSHTSIFTETAHTDVGAVYVTGGFSFILSLIYIGSPTAFYAITSLMTVALLQCYMFSIGSILWRRIYHPSTIPKSHFSLGKWGLPINAVAVVWCLWSFIFSFFPMYKDVTTGTFNWASVIFVAVLVCAGVHWFAYGHKTYQGPVVLVRKL